MHRFRRQRSGRDIETALARPTFWHRIFTHRHQIKPPACGAPHEYGMRTAIRINISSSLMRRRSFCAFFGAAVPRQTANKDNLKRTVFLSTVCDGCSVSD
jgi:hypothetical protein